MKKTLIIAIIILICASRFNAFGQTSVAAIFASAADTSAFDPHALHWHKIADQKRSLGTYFFIFYKKFISSQDAAQCGFHPSCSEYGLRSVRKYGVLKAWPRTFDRLMRCNGFSPELYEQDIEQGLLIDFP